MVLGYRGYTLRPVIRRGRGVRKIFLVYYPLSANPVTAVTVVTNQRPRSLSSQLVRYSSYTHVRSVTTVTTVTTFSEQRVCRNMFISGSACFLLAHRPPAL
jgi:hypothetical protein